MKLTFALTLAAVVVALIKLWHDSDRWRQYPYIDDTDWLMESDPYIDALRRRA